MRYPQGFPFGDALGVQWEIVRRAVLLAVAACGHVGFDPLPAPDSSSDGQCLIDLAGSGDPACVLRTDGRMACWGLNSAGEHGTGTTEDHRDPVLANGVSDAVSIAAGESQACAITSAGSALCWGQNDQGEVGDGTISPRLVPTPVYMIEDVAQIATGQTHTCARHNDGHVSCWGHGARGSVGTIGPDVLIPTPVTGITATTHLTVGDYISCAITADRAQCWGDDFQLGDGTLVDRATPGPVALPDARVIDIAAGCHRHTCALLEDGSAWCWGDNTVYQLGDGTRTTSRVPVQVGGSIRFTQISVGAFHSCGVDPEGNAWCWGDNASNQIDEAAVPAIQPRRIPLPEPIDEIQASCVRTCARSGDRVWCWGDDELAVPSPRSIREIAMPCP